MQKSKHNILSKIFYVLITGIVFVNYACKPPEPTEQDIVNRYKSQYDALQEKLKRIAAKLPPVGSLKNIPKPLEKLGLVFSSKFTENASDKITNNINLISVEEMQDINTKPSFDLGMSSKSLRDAFEILNFRLTRPNNTPSKYEAEKKDETLAQVNNLKYVVAYRTVKYEKPSAGVDINNIKAGATFTGGTAQMEFFLIDLASEEIKTAFPVSASAKDKVVGYVGKELEGFIVQNLKQDALDQASRQIGGEVHLSEIAYTGKP